MGGIRSQHAMINDPNPSSNAHSKIFAHVTAASACHVSFAVSVHSSILLVQGTTPAVDCDFVRSVSAVPC